MTRARPILHHRGAFGTCARPHHRGAADHFDNGGNGGDRRFDDGKKRRNTVPETVRAEATT